MSTGDIVLRRLPRICWAGVLALALAALAAHAAGSAPGSNAITAVSLTNFSASTNLFAVTNLLPLAPRTNAPMAPLLPASTNANAKFGPPANWVKPQFFSQQSAFGVGESGADDQMLLLERQFNPVDNETFIHSARRILTVAGVQKGSTLTTDFNPSYQSLTLHWARLWRGTNHLDRLDTNKVKVVQPEREMDDYILNGKHSAILVLEDVRVGDIIDYAYSVKGQNPVVDGHFAADVPVQLEQPADRLLTRVIWPAQRHLYAKVHGCSVQPSVVAGKEATEYTWDLRQMPAVAFEDYLPGWYDPLPWVQLSEFKTWPEVNQWAYALFKVGKPFSPELAGQIARWTQIASPEERVLAVLRFVQEQVRYFGIELGESAAKPGDPSTVFARRFGDCKDKSLLFVSIMRALGIEAYPVLVNSAWGRAIADWQPSAVDFDHCIAVVQFDGQTYWLDPTMNYQRGPLAAHYLPDYGFGLVISARTIGLSPIPHNTGLPRTTTSEYFRIGNSKAASDLKVVTLAEGREAEALRELFATSKRSDIEKRYTHFYSDLYPGIHLSAPIAFEDDEAQNRVQTTESYSIDGAWSGDKTGKYRCDFYAVTIAGLLRKPVYTDRRSPLGIDYPQYQLLHTEVTLPAAWPADAGQNAVSDAAFNFRKAFRLVGNKLVIEYDYQSLADWVAPDRVAEYLQHLNECSQLLGYELTWR